MKIDIYHLYNYFEGVNFVRPVILDVLRLWSERKGWQVRTKSAKENGVDLNTNAEVVAFSVYTVAAYSAYRLAEKLQAKGKIVILGGPHFRGLHYQEAMGKCDVVASSVCEEQWLSLLEDIEAGKVEPGNSITKHIADTKNHFRYPDDLHKAFSSYSWYQIPAIPTTIGCPYDCEYCSALMAGTYLKRDPEVIYENMLHTKRKTLFIPDASFGLHKKHLMEVMEAIAPLKKHLAVQTSLARVGDKELLKSMAQGGVKVIAIGIETLTQKLGKHGAVSTPEKVEELIRRCHDLGILVQGNFIFGLDCDGPEVFDNVYNFYLNTELDYVIADNLVPYPQTVLYNNLLKQGRIIDQNWSHYDYRHVVFRPLNMSVEDFQNGLVSYHKRISTSKFFLKRLRQLYARLGFGFETAGLASYGLSEHINAKGKAKNFARKLPPSAPPLYAVISSAEKRHIEGKNDV